MLNISLCNIKNTDNPRVKHRNRKNIEFRLQSGLYMSNGYQRNHYLNQIVHLGEEQVHEVDGTYRLLDSIETSQFRQLVDQSVRLSKSGSNRITLIPLLGTSISSIHAHAMYFWMVELNSNLRTGQDRSTIVRVYAKSSA